MNTTPCNSSPPPHLFLFYLPTPFAAHSPRARASQGAACTHARRRAVAPHVRHAFIRHHTSCRKCAPTPSPLPPLAARRKKQHASRPCARSCPIAPPSSSPTDPTVLRRQVTHPPFFHHLTTPRHTATPRRCQAARHASLHLQLTACISCRVREADVSLPPQGAQAALSSPLGTTHLMSFSSLPSLPHFIALTFPPFTFRPPVSFIMLLQQLEQQVKIHSPVFQALSPPPPPAASLSSPPPRLITRWQVQSAGVQSEPLNRALADLRRML